MPNDQHPNPTGPFRVFISHKIGGHGRAAEDMKRELENYAIGRLEVFVSPALDPGVRWRPEVLQRIEEADLFILLYLVEGIEMDWCLYEAGYFEREARRANKRLICMVSPEHGLPGPLEEKQRLEATPAGVQKLLRAIYADKVKPVRPDLFDTENAKTLSQLTDFILKLLQPVKREPLCPRLKIKLGGPRLLEQLKKGILPAEAHLSGEAEALRQLGLKAGDEITVAEFSEKVEFKSALACYVPHLANCLRRIIERYPDLWVIPPVGLFKGHPPRVLVPAYVEKGMDGNYTFEFLVYQPEVDVHRNADTPFDLLSNLFFLGFIFRRRMIEDWRETFMDLRSLGSRAGAEDVHRKVSKFKLTFAMLVLEAMNRNLNSPHQIEKCFPQKEDKEKLRLILDMEKGLYMTYSQQLSEATEAKDVARIVDCLDHFRDINKTLLVMSTRRLQELIVAMEGDMV